MSGTQKSGELKLVFQVMFPCMWHIVGILNFYCTVKFGHVALNPLLLVMLKRRLQIADYADW